MPDCLRGLWLTEHKRLNIDGWLVYTLGAGFKILKTKQMVKNLTAPVLGQPQAAVLMV